MNAKRGENGTPPVDPGPGALVEMTGVLVAADAAKIRAFLALGGTRPAGSVTGRDYFGVSLGESARVLRREGDVLELEFLGGNWKGRSGWTSVGSVRIPPSGVEASLDMVDGQDLLARRRLYAAIHAAGLAATAEAEARFPFGGMPIDAQACRAYLEGRRIVYEETKSRGRAEVAAQHAVAQDQIDRIEAEGDRERWPSWDGLADSRGQIPAFGPARTDARGRIVMEGPERSARLAAGLRVLEAIGLITDETDDDEVWRQASVRFEGAS